MVIKVLCVAEKPSIAKAVANHLANNQVTTVSQYEYLMRDHNLMLYIA